MRLHIPYLFLVIPNPKVMPLRRSIVQDGRPDEQNLSLRGNCISVWLAGPQRDESLIGFVGDGGL